MSTSTILLMLPLEIWIRILRELDFISALRCQSVCKSFNDVVSNSAIIQYNIELGIYGMQDGPSGIPGMASASERLKALQDYQQAWRTLKPRQTTGMPRLSEHTDLYELWGGIWVKGSKHSTQPIIAIRLPSQVRGIHKPDMWTTPFCGIQMIDFGIDPEQDLLVICEEHSQSNKFRVHLRSLSTGLQHPRAKGPGYVVPRLEFDQRIHGHHHSLVFQVMGDILAVLFDSERNRIGVKRHLSIWEWPTGKTLNSHECAIRSFESFAFLSKNLLLVASSVPLIDKENPDPPSLDVYQYGEGTKVNELKLIRSLYLPQIDFQNSADESVIVLAVDIRSDPVAADPYHKSAENPAPFYVMPSHRIFVVSLAISYERTRMETKRYTFFVPMSTVLNALPQSLGGPCSEEDCNFDLAWDDWGIEGAAIITRDILTPIYVCYVYGMRVLMLPQSRNPMLLEEGGKPVVVYDFSPYAAKRPVNPAELEGIKREVITEHRLSAAYNPMFDEDIVTKLPCVRTQTKASQEYISGMMDGDNIILMKRSLFDPAEGGGGNSVELWTM